MRTMQLTGRSGSRKIAPHRNADVGSRHKKRIQFKAKLKLFDGQWKKHGGPPPRPPDKPDFTQEFQWFEEDRWRNSMPVHLRAKREGL